MLCRQNNFGYSQGVGGYIPPLAVSFAEANIAGNGLIVVGYFLAQEPAFSPNLAISDSAGNTYTNIGGVGSHDGANWSSLLQVWYVPACKAGPNTVTVTETPVVLGGEPGTEPGVIPLLLLAASVFEYSGGLGVIDGSNFASGLARPSAALTLSGGAVGDLLFGYAANLGVASAVTVDGSTPGYTTEQAEATSSVWDVWGPVSLLAVARVATSAGLESLTFDFAQSPNIVQILEGLQTALLVALPCALPAPSPPPPPPPGPPSPPVLSSGQAWPTIF